MLDDDLDDFICSECGGPKPDGEFGPCLAYEETAEAAERGELAPPRLWSWSQCSADAWARFRPDDEAVERWGV